MTTKESLPTLTFHCKEDTMPPLGVEEEEGAPPSPSNEDEHTVQHAIQRNNEGALHLLSTEKGLRSIDQAIRAFSDSVSTIRHILDSKKDDGEDGIACTHHPDILHTTTATTSSLRRAHHMKIIPLKPSRRYEQTTAPASGDPYVYVRYLQISIQNDREEPSEKHQGNSHDITMYSVVSLLNLAVLYHEIALRRQQRPVRTSSDLQGQRKSHNPRSVTHCLHTSRQLYRIALQLIDKCLARNANPILNTYSAVNASVAGETLLSMRAMALNNLLAILWKVEHHDHPVKKQDSSKFHTNRQGRKLLNPLLATLNRLLGLLASSSPSSSSSPLRAGSRPGDDQQDTLFFTNFDLQQLALNVFMIKRELAPPLAPAA